MSVTECWHKRKPGYRWNDDGYCYTYTAGNIAQKRKAHRRALAWGKTETVTTDDNGSTDDGREDQRDAEEVRPERI